MARLLQAPAVTLLVTSRERLQLEGEHVWPVPPLVADDGVALFAARAGALGSSRRRRPPSRSSARGSTTCRWRSSWRPRGRRSSRPEQLLERLGAAARPAQGGPRRRSAPADAARDDRLVARPARRGRAAALPPPRRVRRRLHATRRPRRSASADPDTLQSLLDKSLLRRRDATSGRATGCWRRSASTRRSSSRRPEKEASCERRHAGHFLELAEQAEPEMWGLQQRIWFDRLDSEHDNLEGCADRDPGSDEPDMADEAGG